MNEEVKKIGVKAFSLKFLKEKGLFTGNLYISTTLPSKEQFIKDLEKEGFRNVDELSCRFSNPSRAIHFPRMACKSFDEAYNFYKTNFKKGETIIIHNLLHAKYDGTISLLDQELVMEFIEGDWNAGYSLNADTATFRDGVSTWYLYKGKRTVPYVDGTVIKIKEIMPISESTVKNFFENLVPRLPFLTDLLSGEFNSMGVLIDEEGKFQPFKLHNINEASSKAPTIIRDDIFELKSPHDLKRWNRKTKLLISIPANIDRADVLMQMISEIKKYTESVYVGYGELSHPAILLREAGLKVERRISNYKILKFRY